MIMNISKLVTTIQAISDLTDDDNELISLVACGAIERLESEALKSLRLIHTALERVTGKTASFNPDSLVTVESLHELATLASEFDKTGDPVLVKQASVIDDILLTIAVQKSEVAKAQRSIDDQIEKIKLANEKKDLSQHTKESYVEDGQKAVSKVKDYRPLEAPLSTRSCPDHPGSMLGRVSDDTWQCSLDKAVYNYGGGYITSKGNKIPGTSVQMQTYNHEHPSESLSFNSRESRLQNG